MLCAREALALQSIAGELEWPSLFLTVPALIGLYRTKLRVIRSHWRCTIGTKLTDATSGHFLVLDVSKVHNFSSLHGERLSNDLLRQEPSGIEEAARAHTRDFVKEHKCRLTQYRALSSRKIT